MQIRQVLTQPEFLNALNRAETKEARVSELQRLKEHAAALKANVSGYQRSEQFDIDFQPFRVWLESQSVIIELKDLVEKAKSDISDDELRKIVEAFVDDRNEHVARTHSDYFPSLPTSANGLLWQLAKGVAKEKNISPVKVLVSTLNKESCNDGKAIQQGTLLVLNQTREYPMFPIVFLNRLAQNKGHTSYHNPVTNENEPLNDLEKIRLAASYARFSEVSSLRPNLVGQQAMFSDLKKLRQECAIALSKDDVKNAYHSADQALYHHTLQKPWLVKKPALLFEFMSCLSNSEWDEYVNNILKQSDIAKTNPAFLMANEAVKEKAYYTDSDQHNAGVLYFFAALYVHERDGGLEYDSIVPRIVSYVSTTAADSIAYNKNDKEAAIKFFMVYLKSGEPLSRDSMRAYFIKNGNEALLAPLCQPKSKSNAFVEQLDVLAKLKHQHEAAPVSAAPTSTAKQGLFAAAAPAPVSNVVSAVVQPTTPAPQVAPKMSS